MSLPFSRTSISINGWLENIFFRQYSTAILEFGYDTLNDFDAASDEDIEEMTLAVDMEKPYRRVLMETWGNT